MTRVSKDAAPVFAALERWGLLLLQDAHLPSLSTIVAGEPVVRSWWGHPRGDDIFLIANELEEHPDVGVAKLVSGKVTYVHRRLLPALVAVGSARDPWQLGKLTTEARALLATVIAEKRVPASGPAAKELEQRLLVASEQVHTPKGKHVLELMTWETYGRSMSIAPYSGAPAHARNELEQALSVIVLAHEAPATLPWQSRERAKR